MRIQSKAAAPAYGTCNLETNRDPQPAGTASVTRPFARARHTIATLNTPPSKPISACFENHNLLFSAPDTPTSPPPSSRALGCAADLPRSPPSDRPRAGPNPL